MAQRGLVGSLERLTGIIGRSGDAAGHGRDVTEQESEATGTGGLVLRGNCGRSVIKNAGGSSSSRDDAVTWMILRSSGKDYYMDGQQVLVIYGLNTYRM